MRCCYTDMKHFGKGNCCSGETGFRRKFQTMGEKREKLERYRDELKLELQGVEEVLEQLSK